MKKNRIKNLRNRTTFLLPRKNILIGMGSIFNLQGKYFEYSTSRSATEANRRALDSDWKMVGEDIKKAQREYQGC
ncbi:hypothetical protein RG089_003050 [Elizabethkingia anophelis]|nr:hypothetical protein [Elizabethkingia anophelis]